MTKYMADRVQPYGTTIFTEMSALAVKHQAINLGQGFPNFAAPDFVVNAAKEALEQGINQYPPSSGRPRLREAVALTWKQQRGIGIDPATQVCAMHGATEVIFATMSAIINPGDEVVLFEPYYDSYVPAVTMAGGIPRFYTLRPPEWGIDAGELEKLFSNKTKAVIFNTPHNPIGKVFTRAELQIIAKLCQKYDVIAVADEVYEHIIFDGAKHVSIASLDGMEDRTVTASSAGKTFSVTGWKVGWAVAAPHLIQTISRSHQWTTFAGAAPLEEATAVALESASKLGYYDWLADMYQAKRNKLARSLAATGLEVLMPQGTYYIMVDISNFNFADDRDFCAHLIKEVGVVAIPPSAFFQNPADGASIARFAFCKTDEMLDEAANRLQDL